VVQPGVTLSALDDVLRDTGLAYQVHPGERGGSLGGNVATNAGGMRAVKYGVTRHQVLGVEAVLASGEVLRSGGHFVKSSSGYDLTQLIVGSEGTLALVTEATLLLHPRPPCQATVLAPFTTVEQVCSVVPDVVASGVGPVMCEYLDSLTMAAVTSAAGLDLGVAPVVREGAQAYLVVGLESRTPESLDADAGVLAELLGERGALDVYLLPAGAARRLIEAREKLFWVAKAAGADDIVDVVVPRAAVPVFLERVAGIAERTGSRITGCGHAGDGNVRLSIFQPDPAVRHDVLTGLFRTGLDLGGAISGEHGIGMAKKKYFQELNDPLALELLRRIKHAFAPRVILGPGTIFD
jgi:glycolate oxidase